jgi:hypothetical protein
MKFGRRFGLSLVAVSAHHLAACVALGDWAEAREILSARRADGPSSIVEWEVYLSVGASLIAWGSDDAGVLVPAPSFETSDAVVIGWQLVNEAVEIAFEGDARRGASLAAKAVRRTSDFGLANEDVPLVFALAVDMLVAADGMTAELRSLVDLLDQIPSGQRYRLLDGTLQRAKAHLDEVPLEKLRSAVAIFDQMGAAYWAARVRVELAAALDAAGEPGAAATLDAAEPVLVAAGANRALRELADVRDRLATGVLSS